MTSNDIIETKTFPILYGVDKNKKIKQWNIKVTKYDNYSELIYSYGYNTGKKVECRQTISKGKNIGKKNETTHFEQAILEAQSKWDKKQDIDKYQIDIIESNDTDVKNIKSNTIGSEVTHTLLPMLAQDYKKHMKKITFPCFIQPKLDGYRMIYNSVSKTVTTRTGKDFKILYETELYKELIKIPYSLDGELYVHDKTFVFENYGILRKTKNLTKNDHELLNRIEYHVYDIPDEKLSYNERKQILESLNFISKIKLVNTIKCDEKKEIDNHHEIFVKDGYEGSIVRNSNALYKCKYRSYDLLKYKDFDDGEYKIIGFTSEKDTSVNKETNGLLVVWICNTTDNKKFNVRPKGTEEERKELYKNADTYINQMLWVKYFGLTENGIPRFPTTVRDTFTEYIRNTII